MTKSYLKLTIILLAALMLSTWTHAQVMDGDDDFGFDFDADLDVDIQLEAPTPVEAKREETREVESSYTLMHRFVPKSNRDLTADISSEKGWTKRATLKLVTSDYNEVRRVQVNNEKSQDMDQHNENFKKHCENGDKYQLAIKELGLITTVSACAYVENGLGDALVFSLDHNGSIISFAYQKSYTKYKKAPKKWVTEGLVRKIEEGPRPQFKFKNYDTFGKEKLDEKEIKQKQEEDQPWYSKYWWALLIGGVLFMQLLAPEPPQEGGAAPAGGNAAPAPRPAAK